MCGILESNVYADGMRRWRLVSSRFGTERYLNLQESVAHSPRETTSLTIQKHHFCLRAVEREVINRSHTSK